MKKIILDVGANKGQNVTKFREVYGTDYTVYSFEPNPECIKLWKEKWENIDNVHLIEAGASTETGENTFYLGRYTTSSSLRQDKTTFMSGKKITIKVIDLCEWIKEHASPEDEIILYMDIEGGEYDIIDKLISKDMLGWFNEVYMEFHEKKLKNLDQNQHKRIYNTLIETYGDKVYIHGKYQQDKYEIIG